MSQGPNTPGDQGPGDGAPPPPPAPQDPGATTGAAQPADLGTRFLAKLIDWILIGVVIGVIIVPLTIGLAFSGVGMGGAFGMGFDIGGIIASLVMYGLALGYFAFMESNKGQTVGKMLLKLQVRGPDGGMPSMEKAVKRNAYMLLPIIPFLGGLAYFVIVIYIAVTINGDEPWRQGWHDKFADGTQVVKIG